LGQREGQFAAHLDSPLTAIAILAILNSVQQWFRPEGRCSLEQVTAPFTGLILLSVAVDPGPPGGGGSGWRAVPPDQALKSTPSIPQEESP
jgi:hypothetical protein